MSMTTKTITIMEDAYELLAANKESSESFSDEIRRVFTKKRGLMALAGTWKDVPSEEIAKMKKSIYEGRKSKRLNEALGRP